MQDREKLIKYNKAFIKKNKKIPTTTLDFYKFVKLIGKGAFGKVTLGIHKLTGKYKRSSSLKRFATPTSSDFFKCLRAPNTS